MTTPKPVHATRRRLSLSRKSLVVAASATAVALALLVCHIFVAQPALQSAALWALGAALLAVWIAVLGWRVPVYTRRRLVLLGGLWVLGLAASVLLALIASRAAEPLGWRLGVQWLALTLSLAIGALFLRVLLRVRTSPRLGRLLSLVTPLCILGLILVLGRRVT